MGRVSGISYAYCFTNSSWPWGVWDVFLSVCDLQILADPVAGKSKACWICGSRFRVIRSNHKWLSRVFLGYNWIFNATCNFSEYIFFRD